MTERMASGWRYTLHMMEQAQIRAEQKPGTGIDRTLIRRLLAVSPSERVKLLERSILRAVRHPACDA